VKLICKNVVKIHGVMKTKILAIKIYNALNLLSLFTQHI